MSTQVSPGILNKGYTAQGQKPTSNDPERNYSGEAVDFGQIFDDRKHTPRVQTPRLVLKNALMNSVLNPPAVATKKKKVSYSGKLGTQLSTNKT
jgi:hypothetical protein